MSGARRTADRWPQSASDRSSSDVDRPDLRELTIHHAAVDAGERPDALRQVDGLGAVLSSERTCP